VKGGRDGHNEGDYEDNHDSIGDLEKLKQGSNKDLYTITQDIDMNIYFDKESLLDHL